VHQGQDSRNSLELVVENLVAEMVEEQGVSEHEAVAQHLDVATTVDPVQSDVQVEHSIPVDGDVSPVVVDPPPHASMDEASPLRRTCTTSCPPSVEGLTNLCRWSLEWLKDHNYGET